MFKNLKPNSNFLLNENLFGNLYEINITEDIEINKNKDKEFNLSTLKEID